MPEDTLYVPIKQVYFDQIIEGTKKVEYREVPGYPIASKYLVKDDGPSHYKLDPEHTTPGGYYEWNDYNGGHYPFVPRPFKKLYMAVGYSPDRDTALVEIEKITFRPERIKIDRQGNPCYCNWIMEIHLGKVLELYRKAR